MNKMSKQIGLGITSLAVALGVGFAIENTKKATAVNAAQGDELAILTPAGTTYSARQTTTDKYEIGWVQRGGQGSYFGANNATNHNAIKPTADDLPVIKAVDDKATTTTTGYYFYYTTSPITYAGSMEFYYSANSGNDSAKGYVVYSSTASESGSAAWTQVPLANNSAKAQGASLGTSGTFTYTFAETQTSAKYYGFVIETSSYKRMTNGKISIKEGSSSSPLISVAGSSSIKKGQNGSLSVSYANVASGVTINASSSNTNVATVTASQTTTGASGSATFTVNGLAEGTATITFSATYDNKNLQTSCLVTIYEEKTLTKITKPAQLNTSRQDGGRYVIVSAASNTVAMSTTQNTNNRGKTSATINDGVMSLSGATDIAVVNILKSGDYYTIYDEANEGYLYGASSNNYLKTSDPDTKTDEYYWTIDFSNNNAIITNKKSGYVIRYNSNNSIFSTYNGSQGAIQLYEVEDDIPPLVKLSSVSADNDSIPLGAPYNYTASYLPINATEGIIASGNNDNIATVDSASMSNGILTVTITPKAAGSITLTIVGDDEATVINEQVTITVTAYTATHTLVTDDASLSNGSKVIIGCTDADYNYSAEKSTGANNLNGVETPFAANKSSLAASPNSQQFTVWCIDDTNGYYVFSDGGYYLQAPTSANNYLQRTESLTENCYFTIQDNAEGVVVESKLHSSYSIQFNSSTSKFTLYSSSQKKASLYLSNGVANPIQGFVDVFMHFGNVPDSGEKVDTNACRNNGDGAKGYFAAAIDAFNNDLTQSQREEFVSDYDDAFNRLDWWAKANGYDWDLDDMSLYKPANKINYDKYSDDSSIVITVTIISSVSLIALASALLIKHRKEQ